METSVLMGIRIRLIRQQLDMTLEDLAALSGISKSHISNIELGKTRITVDTAALLARALQVPFEELVKDLPEITVDSSVRIPDISVLVEYVPNIIKSISSLNQLFQMLFKTK